MSKDRPELVVIHNNLARHAASSLAPVGPLGHRILAAAIAKLDKDLEEGAPIRCQLEIAELLTEEKTQKAIYERVHDALHQLTTTAISFQHPETGRTVVASWMAGDYIVGEGWIDCEFYSKLYPVLNSLKTLRTEMSLESILNLKGGGYAYRLYHLASSWKDRQGWTTNIETLRQQLGVPDDAYPRPTDFRRYALDRPIAAINERTDLRLAYKKANRGRSWTSIRFDVLPQKHRRQEKPIKEAQRLTKSEQWFVDCLGSEKGRREVHMAAAKLGLVLVDYDQALRLEHLREHHEELHSACAQGELFGDGKERS